MIRKVHIEDLGLIRYDQALFIQRVYHEQLVNIKKSNRILSREIQICPEHFFLFCEHFPVFTLGRTGNIEHLLATGETLEQEHIEFFQTNRGGDITYHGPGQIVGYPIWDLEYFFTDVHKFISGLEETIIRTLSEYSIQAIRVPGFTGVWLEENGVLPQRKICAIGIHLSRWISMHGFAFNIGSDIRNFNKIIPCGISPEQKSVTSLELELQETINRAEVKNKLLKHMSEIFDFQYIKENDWVL